MPVSEDRLHKSDRLNRWFAVSSLLMTLSIIWMIQVDHARPWRGFQDRYFVGKAALAHLDFLDAAREVRREELELARQLLKDARAYAAETTGSLRAELAHQLAEAELEFKKVNDPWSRASQILDVTRDTYERTLGKYGPGHELTVAAHAQLRTEEEHEERLRKEKEHWEDTRKQVERRVREIDEPVILAEKQVRELKSAAEDALAKDRQYRGVLADKGPLGRIPVVKALINAPLFDFTAPKTTPGRERVEQLVLPDVRQRLNYLETYTTDRCTTCHIAIDDPEFSRERLARKLERSLEGINDELERMGMAPYEPPAPPVLAQGGVTLPSGTVTEHWEELTPGQQTEYFDALLGTVNDYLRASGRKEIDLNQPVQAHPNLDLYVTIDSPHPMARMGCTVCHEGNPQETDFVQAAHSPPTHEIEQEWKEQYYITLLGVPNVTLETISHYWDRPMHLPRYSDAGCAKCHSQITDIATFDAAREGTSINLGRHLFTAVGCVNCHDVEQLAGSRRVGPDLTHVASKLTPGFVQPWVYFPRKFRPSTLMPHFFHQENNRAAGANQFDAEPELRTETEVAAMSTYLFAVSRDWEPIKKPAGVEGDAERGRQLFRSVGCLACHANLAEFGEEWVTKDLVARKGFDPETAAHRYKGMTYEERVLYALENFVNERDTFLHPDRARFDPDKPYNPPSFSRFAPELSGIGSKVTFEWLYSWLIEPTHYSSETKMPSLRLRPAEVADIAAYLLTLKNDAFEQGEIELDERRSELADELAFILLSAQRSERRSRAILDDEGDELTNMLVALLASALGRREAYDLIRPMTLEQKKLMFLGNKMISHYGCYACHTIPGFETATPPGTDLSAWAEKPVTQLDFAFYDDAFHEMRAEQEDTFGYVYPRDANELNYWSPLDDLTREQITHTHAAFIKHKLLNPRIWDRGKIKRPYDKLKMPNFYFTQEESDALTTFMLSRVPPRVNENLRIDYEGTTLGPIAKGRTLTRELNCLACHEIEDNVPTVHQYFRREAGSGPIFDRVNAPPSLRGEGAKLQHNWFHRFLQHVEPLRPWLQIRMPSFNITGEEATTLVEYFAALSQADARKLADMLAPVDEYIETQRASTPASADEQEPAEPKRDGEAHRVKLGPPPPGADWYEQERLRDTAAGLQRWAMQREIMRPTDLDPFNTPPDRFRKAHATMLKRVRAMKQVYDVEYPFVEPPRPLSAKERFEHGFQFFNDMGCLKCHVLGRMLEGPASHTDDFVQTYRLDGVRGEGDAAVAILNDQPYPVGSVIDGHTLVAAENVYYDTGDVETKAYVEGPGPSGETERIMLQAASAPNLSLTHQRLRRGWVYQWMLIPGLIQPGTKMPQNFPNGRSPFEGDERHPGTGEDHINLLVDFLYDAGASGARAPLLKIIAAQESEAFDEEEVFDEDEFD